MAKGFAEASLNNQKNSKSSSIKPNIDCEQIQKQWAKHFEDLTDPRGSQGVLHPFMSIVMIALLATIGGAKGWEDIETMYWHLKLIIPPCTKRLHNGLKMLKLQTFKVLITAMMFGLNRDIIAVKNVKLQQYLLSKWGSIQADSMVWFANHSSSCSHSSPLEQNYYRSDVLSQFLAT